MLLLPYALIDTMLLIAYSFQNLKLEFDNYTSREFDNFMKIQVYEWQPFYDPIFFHPVQATSWMLPSGITVILSSTGYRCRPG